MVRENQSLKLKIKKGEDLKKKGGGKKGRKKKREI